MSFGEIFTPGLRYLREEKERQKMLVSKPTHGGGSPLGIDLEAGVAKITVRRPASEPVDPAAGDPADASPATGSGTAPDPAEDPTED